MKSLMRNFPFELPRKYFEKKFSEGTWISQLRNFLVKIYQNLGIVALIIILFLVLGYFVLLGFFFFNRNWSIPFILNPYSEKVLQMRKQVISATMEVNTFRNKKFMIERKISMYKIKIDNEVKQQQHLNRFIQQEQEEKKVKLFKVEKIYQDYKESFRIFTGGKEFTIDDLKKKNRKLESDYKNQLLSYEEFWKVKGDLWQNQGHKTDFQFKLMQIESELGQIKKDLSTFEMIAKDKESSGQTENSHQLKEEIKQEEIKEKEKVSYQILTLKNEQLKGQEQNWNNQIEMKSLQDELRDTNKNLQYYHQFLKVLSESPYAKAFNKNIVMAFVPYEHMENIRKNYPIYGCKFKLFWCDKIGHVSNIPQGEVVQSHPLFNRDLRGRIIEMKLEEVTLGESDLLHIGRPPFLLVF